MTEFKIIEKDNILIEMINEYSSEVFQDLDLRKINSNNIDLILNITENDKDLDSKLFNIFSLSDVIKDLTTGVGDQRDYLTKAKDEANQVERQETDEEFFRQHSFSHPDNIKKRKDQINELFKIYYLGTGSRNTTGKSHYSLKNTTMPHKGNYTNNYNSTVKGIEFKDNSYLLVFPKITFDEHTLTLTTYQNLLIKDPNDTINPTGNFNWNKSQPNCPNSKPGSGEPVKPKCWTPLGYLNNIEKLKLDKINGILSNKEYHEKGNYKKGIDNTYYDTNFFTEPGDIHDFIKTIVILEKILASTGQGKTDNIILGWIKTKHLGNSYSNITFKNIPDTGAQTDPELGNFYDMLKKLDEEGFEDIEISKIPEYKTLLGNINSKLNDNWPKGPTG